jgi:glycerol-3-phosphate O-acyltransferase / dihydroxyacetone phosphate acyltransferase
VWSWDAIVGLPLFAYGAVVNALPYFIPRSLARRMASKETDYATVRLLASVVAYPVFYALQTWIVWRLAGARVAALFAISLPLSGIIAYRYLVGAGRLRSRLRFTALAWTQVQTARRLVAERQVIIAELARAKTEYVTATRGSSF